MATTNVEIVNDALARLGVSPINALSDTTKQAQFANRFYNQTLDEVLASRQWPFATKRASLTAITPKPTAEWGFGYNLPADYLRLVQINNDEIAAIKHKYAIEGSRLMTDESAVTIVYVARETTVSLYSPLFCEAMSIKLASKLCGPLTGSKEMAVEFLKLYEQTFSVPEIGEQPQRTRRAKGATLSSVDIANAALSLIGVSPINAFTDNSLQAQLVDRLYDQTRDEVMALRPWTFATKRVSPLGTTNAAGSEYARTYTLPADYLSLVQIDDDDVQSIQNKYALEGKNLLIDRNPVEICYVARITDVSFYSPLFIEALSYKLALKLAGPLFQGENKGILETLAASFEKAIATPQIGEQAKRANRTKSGTVTSVEIANMALSMLGVSPIAAFNDNSIQAQLADRLYDQTRDEVMAAVPWAFAIKRVAPTGANTTAGSEWARTYTLPADYLRLIQIDDDDVETIQHKYALEGKNLLTDANPVEICYLARISDVSFYSPLFIEALSYKLAIKLAGPLSQGDGKNNTETLTSAYEKTIASALVTEASKRTKRQKAATFDAVEISNTALALIGVGPIASLSDGSVQAQLCDRLYERTRDEVLEACAWPFAVKRATLSGTTNVAGSEYARSYPLPADYVRLLQINDDEISTIEHKYTIEGSTLLTDANPVEIVYIFRVTNATAYSPTFVEAFTHKLATKLFGPLSAQKDPQFLASLQQTYQAAIAAPHTGQQTKRTNRTKSASLAAVDICNMALTAIGVGPILSLSDPSVQAQLADRLYEQTRDEVLTARPWPFAIKRASPSSTVNAAGSEYARTYALPNDYLHLVQIDRDDIDLIKHKYAIEGKSLLTDRTAIEICYVARITDVSFFSPSFVEALMCKLASKFAGPLLPENGKAVADSFLASYATALEAPDAGSKSKRTNRKKNSPVDAVEICNMALGLIGISPILTLTDSSVQAQMADRLYEQTRDEVLSVRPWTFATKRSTLSGTATAAGSEYARSYTLPNDYLSLLTIEDDDIASIQHKYSLEGKNLLTDRTPVEIGYVARVTDVSFYSPLFIEALSYKLAIKLAGPLIEGDSKGIIESLSAAYDKAIATPQSGEDIKRSSRNKSATINETEIANMALGMLGISPITSLADLSVQAQMADRYYAITRDEVLASHRWNFAMRRAALTKAVTAPSFEWTFAYTLPAGCLRVVQLNGYDPNEPMGEFAIEGAQLLTDADPAEIRYINRETAVTTFPALFVNALAVLLAARMGPSLGIAPDVISALEQKFVTLTGPRARLSDVFEEHAQIKPAWAVSGLVRSRFTRYADSL